MYVQKSKLRQMREQRGWTQKDVADKLDLPDTRTLRRWESGDALPSLRYRARLCTIFERSPEDLGFISEHTLSLVEEEESRLAATNEPDDAKQTTLSRLRLLFPLNRLSVSPDHWNRQRLLEKVYTFWIKECFEQSRPGGMHIELELQEQPDAVTNPWQQDFEQAPRLLCPLSPAASSIQVYDDACGELLILGEPGAGKTTLLLEVTCELLLRAFENENHPMPVVFNLSSWSVERLPLAAWLVQELGSKYQVPQRVGQAWIENDQILPLLDGLDEVSPALRNACVTAINVYRQAHGLLPMVVCSRREEYLNMDTQLLLQKAVCIQPLTLRQIDECLTGKDERLEALRQALHSDRDLQQLATTPLMLSVLVLAYHWQSVEMLKEPGSIEMRRGQLFALYVQHMFKRRKQGEICTPQQSMRWLAYLARQMKQSGQTVFYLERMQLNWLPTRRLQQICYGLFVGLWAGLVSGVLIGFMAKALGNSPVEALVITPLVAVVLGMIVGVAGSLLKHVLFRPTQKILIGALAVSIFGGGTIWLSNMFPTYYSIQQYGSVAGLVVVFVLLLLSVKDATIRPAEVVNWSWRRVWNTTFSSSFVVIALIYVGIDVVGGSLGWVLPDLSQGIIVIMLFGLLSFFSAGLLNGFSNTMLDERLIAEPNQGIRRSAYYALRNGLVAWLLNWFALIIAGTLLGRFFPALVVNPDFVVYSELAFSLTIGLTIGIHKGGDACIKHLLLRIMLAMGRHIPWNYARFLNYAVEHILLYRVGGGYMFVHRLLLDYFASLNERELDS